MRGLEIADFGGKGRGVIITQAIQSGALIERCPVIIVPSDQRACLKDCVLADYYFNWPLIWPEGGPPALAIVLGYGSLYNHAYEPNTRIALNGEAQSVDIYALRDISKGEELTHNYRGRPRSTRGVGFEVKL